MTRVNEITEMTGVTRMTRVNEITEMTGVTRMTKRLDHGFRQKFEIFLCFYFWQNQPAKCL